MSDAWKQTLAQIFFGALYTYAFSIFLALPYLKSSPLWVIMIFALLGLILIVLFIILIYSAWDKSINKAASALTNFIKQNILLILFISLELYLLNSFSQKFTTPIDIIKLGFTYIIFFLIVDKLRNLINEQRRWPLSLRFRNNKIEDWIARTTQQVQGLDAKQIPLQSNQRIKTLIFNIQSNSPYWRAGFKLTNSNGSLLPLRGHNGLLVHLYKDLNSNQINLRIYPDGMSIKKSITKQFQYSPDSIFNIKLVINEKNFLSLEINNSVEYKEKYDPTIYEKAYLTTWGDEDQNGLKRQYEIKFTDIYYVAQ